MARHKTVRITLGELVRWLFLVVFTIANLGYTVLWLFFERPKCECAGKETTEVVFKAPIKKYSNNER